MNLFIDDGLFQNFLRVRCIPNDKFLYYCPGGLIFNFLCNPINNLSLLYLQVLENEK